MDQLFNNCPNLCNLIQYLKFGSDFNHPIDFIEKCINLQCLKFGWYFNYPIRNLPKSLKYLQLDFKFQQQIDYLPESLTNLLISSNYNYLSLLEKKELLNYKYHLSYNEKYNLMEYVLK